MKISLLVSALTLGLAAPAFAQNAPPPAAAGDPGYALRTACRQQVRGQGLRGMGLMQAVSACVVRQRPALAQREQCRLTAVGRGMPGNQIHAYVENCAKGRS